MLTLLGFRETAAAAVEDKHLSFSLTVPEAHKKTVENELVYEEVKKAESKGVVVWVFLGLALAPAIVQAVIKLQRKRLPSGLIVVLQPDGKVQFERDAVEGPEKIIEAIMKGLGGK
jgi:hypothetical protein